MFKSASSVLQSGCRAVIITFTVIIVATIARCVADDGYDAYAQSYVSIAVDPTGNRLALVGAKESFGKLFILNITRKRAAKVPFPTADSQIKLGPSFDRSGSDLVYDGCSSMADPTHIYRWSSATKTAVQLTSGSTIFDCYPSFSRDGGTVVFARATWLRPYSMGGNTADHWDIWIMKSDGSGQRRITSGNYRQLDPPYFVGTTSKVVFGATYTLEKSNLYLVDTVAKGPPIRLTHDDQSSDPYPSTNGSQLAFTTTPINGANCVCLYDLSRHSVLPLPDEYPGRLKFTPQFMLGDQSIIFTVGDPSSGQMDIYRQDLASGVMVLIADGSIFNDPLAWRFRAP